MWSTAKRRTAIAANSELGAGGRADVEEDVAPLRPGRAIALVGVVLLAVGMAVLPALVGSGLAPRPVALVAAGLGSLVAVFGGVKLAAVILGAARFRAEPTSRVPAAGID